MRTVRASSYYELRRRWPDAFCIKAERGGYSAIVRRTDMQTYHVWPDGTTCYAEDLEGYLTFMSDDYVTCTTPDEDLDAVPSYDEIVTAMRRFNDVSLPDSP